MKTLFFDIETNEIEDWTNLTDLHTVHCLSIYDPMIAKMITYHGDGIPNGIQELNKAQKLIGHNILGFDIPALDKCYGFKPSLDKIVDTLIMSRCIHPDLRTEDFKRRGFSKELVGSHSLKAWGNRMHKVTKLSYGEEDGAFDEYNEEMRKYCERDVIVTQLLFDALSKKKPSRIMLDLEHRFARAMLLQERHGFKFDIAKAEKLEKKLFTRRAELLDRLQSEFPAKEEEMKTASGWSLKIDIPNGVEVITAKTKGDLKKELKARGLVQALANQAEKLENKKKITPFNPGSRKQIAEHFLNLGFELPKERDAKTYKVDEAVLRSIDHPFASLLCDYLLVTKRLGQLSEGKQAWLKLVTKGGRIHGRVNTNGAVTGRCTHANPNMAQVPACRAEYGVECRDLFIPGNGYDLVGCDASGLELRMLAHYLTPFDNGMYAKTVCEGDIHSLNQQAAGLETRDQAKKFTYAFLYGAGDSTIGKIVGGGRMHGRALRRKFLSNLPALERLQGAVQLKVFNNGKLRGLDGRKLPIRSPHAALNVLLQSAGAVVMKTALVILYKHLLNIGWQHGREYAFVANIHDEFQAEVLPEHAEAFGQLAVKAIRGVAPHYKMNVDLDGEYKIGSSWAETH